MKYCPQCKKEISKKKFYTDITKSGGYNTYCKICTKERSKAWRLQHPERCREIHRKWKENNSEKVKQDRQRWHYQSAYGISIIEKEEMIQKQQNKCAICQNILIDFSNSCIDHDHKTKQIRKILCRECNTGLGMFKDSSALLRKAADYLDSFAS